VPDDGDRGPAGAAQGLAGAPLFAGLPAAVLEVFAERSADRTYARGEVVFLRGQPGTAMYLVVSGLLKVYDSSADGTELVLATVPPGATVGELALADGGPRSASVAALHPSRLLAVSRDAFRSAVRTEGLLAERLLTYVAAHLRRLTDFAADLVFLDLPNRVAELLTRLAADGGRPVRPGLVLPELTQTELAAMVGASRQSTNAVLRGFAQAGWIELDGRRIRVLAPDRLRDRARSPGPPAGA